MPCSVDFWTLVLVSSPDHCNEEMHDGRPYSIWCLMLTILNHATSRPKRAGLIQASPSRGLHRKWNSWRGCVVVVLCLLVGAQDSRSAELSEIVQLVETRGWSADLGRICQEFALEPLGSDCIFKQISVQEEQGRGDPRGINVPARTSEVSCVLIFHLGPLVGEFFIVSPQGELLKTFIRTKGRGYEQISNDDVRDEFLADLAYWTDNFTRIRAGLDSQNGRRR